MKKLATKLTIEHSKAKAERFLKAALSKKALRPILLRLDKLTPITDYFLIVSGKSARHAKSIADAIVEDAHSDSTMVYSVEGLTQGNWVLLDLGEVIIHVFQDHSREFYDLEGLWSDAPREVFSPDIIKEIEVAGEMDEEEDDFLIS
jgi:ribosome-associated protein